MLHNEQSASGAIHFLLFQLYGPSSQLIFVFDIEGGIAHFLPIGLYWQNRLWNRNHAHLFFKKYLLFYGLCL
jgi:hypothetical protein